MNEKSAAVVGESRNHHPIVRITHWVNAIALTIMVGSGLRIFNAYPAFARRGETFCCYPFEHKAIPRAFTFGGWLAGARNWHFAMMWVLVINGLVYLAFIYLHGEWRDVVPRKSFPRDAWAMMSYYLFIRKRHPVQGKYNALQRGTYFILPVVGVVAVISGIAIWKPVQLQLLTDVLGGYVWARYWHFLSMVALVALSAIHIFMVFTVDPYALKSITIGGYDERKSPEARNARPFYHLFTRPGATTKSHPTLATTESHPALAPTAAFPIQRSDGLELKPPPPLEETTKANDGTPEAKP